MNRNQAIIVIFIILLVSAFFYLNKDKPQPTTVPENDTTTTISDEPQKHFLEVDPESQQIIPVSTNTKTYTWGVFSFKYPSDWKVKEDLYLTPAAQEAHEKPEVVGLILKPNDSGGQNSYENSFIGFGGRQLDCLGSDLIKSKCITYLNTPIYTRSANSSVLSVYDIVIKSLVHDNTHEAYPFLAPKHNEVLKVGQNYPIKWKIKDKEEADYVDITILDTFTGQGMLSERVKNVGVYDWKVPPVSSAGPFYVSVHYCKSVKPTGGALAACEDFQGNSDLFLIVN